MSYEITIEEHVQFPPEVDTVRLTIQSAVDFCSVTMSRSDAHELAAARDMRLALEAIRPVLDAWAHFDPHGVSKGSPTDMVFAALAKAEGRE
jgi:hypothetical protein